MPKLSSAVTAISEVLATGAPVSRRGRLCLRLFAFGVLALTAACASGPRAPNQIEALVDFGTTPTTARFGPLLVSAPRVTHDKTLYRWAFDPENSERRRRELLAGIASTAGVQAGSFKEYQGPLVEAWNAKLRVVAGSSIISIASIENRRLLSAYEVLSDASQVPPPILHVDLTNASVKVEDRLFGVWIEFLKQRVDLDGLCVHFGAGPCSHLLSEAEKEYGSGKVKKKDEFEVGVRTVLTSPNFVDASRRLLDFLYFKHEWRLALHRGGRKIYVTEQTEFSPQVDLLGNLYLSSHLLDRLSLSEWDLVLSHEAAHIIAIEFDQYLAAILHTANTMQKDDPPQSYLGPLLKLVRAPDEMFIDSVAFAYFKLDAEEIRRYSSILERVEPDRPERREGALVLAKMVDAGVDLRNHVLRRMFVRLSECGPVSAGLPRPSLSEAVHTRQLEIEYRKHLNAYIIRWGIVQAVGAVESEEPVNTTQVFSRLEEHLKRFDCAPLHVHNKRGTITIMIPSYPVGGEK